jgi:hypothetical protein
MEQDVHMSKSKNAQVTEIHPDRREQRESKNTVRRTSIANGGTAEVETSPCNRWPDKIIKRYGSNTNSLLQNFTLYFL